MALSPCESTIGPNRRETISHGDAALPAACYFDDLSREPVPWHWHDEMEALRVVEGRAAVKVGSEQYDLRAGEGLWINSGALHAAWRLADGGCRFHSLVFHARLVGGGPESVFWQNYLSPILLDSSLKCLRLTSAVPWQTQALAAIESAWQSLAAEGPGYEFSLREGLSRLIWLVSDHRPACRRPIPERQKREAERVKAMLQFMNEHYAEELTAKQIAASALVSESECLRSFHSVLGSTPIQYLRQFRVQKAAELLLATDWKISDIAARCGFWETSYFAKTFQIFKGLTPSEYRKRQKAQFPSPE